MFPFFSSAEIFCSFYSGYCIVLSQDSFKIMCKTEALNRFTQSVYEEFTIVDNIKRALSEILLYVQILNKKYDISTGNSMNTALPLKNYLDTAYLIIMEQTLPESEKSVLKTLYINLMKYTDYLGNYDPSINIVNLGEAYQALAFITIYQNYLNVVNI